MNRTVCNKVLDLYLFHNLAEVREIVSQWRRQYNKDRPKGCLPRDGMLHIMSKLGQCAEQQWRRLRGFNYLGKVITGVKFTD